MFSNPCGSTMEQSDLTVPYCSQSPALHYMLTQFYVICTARISERGLHQYYMHIYDQLRITGIQDVSYY